VLEISMELLPPELNITNETLVTSLLSVEFTLAVKVFPETDGPLFTVTLGVESWLTVKDLESE